MAAMVPSPSPYFTVSGQQEPRAPLATLSVGEKLTLCEVVKITREPLGKASLAASSAGCLEGQVIEVSFDLPRVDNLWGISLA